MIACDNDIYDQLFLDILNNKKITSVFQPILSLRDGSVYGYEALSRGPMNSPLHTPDRLFKQAEKMSKTWELELLCRTVAIETISRISSNERLFLNVNPQIMHDEKFRQGFTKEFLKQYNMYPENIIFEITEKGTLDNARDLVNTVEHYKKQNYLIAIDDAGAGYSGLNMISDIQPHFIKLDMSLIRGIHQDTNKQALIKSFSEFASLTKTYLIAEGIETKEELLKLIDIGIHYGQGYFIQRPNPQIMPIPDDILQVIKRENEKKNHLYYKKSADLYIKNIAYSQKTLHPDIKVLQVYEMMKSDISSSGYCITEDGKVLGIITRASLFNYLSGQYGYALYSKKTIKGIMNTDFLVVEESESVKTVSRKAMSRAFDHLYDFIVVVAENHYIGIVTVKDLLEKTMEAEVYTAKHLNPLSELPGNILIEKKLQECINSRIDNGVMYLDIDNFKAYNDVYGFENGDTLLKGLVQILRDVICDENDFIGHIGGDDFVAVTSCKNIEKTCLKLIDDFEQATKKYYNQNDLTKGYISCKNRHGNEEDFPLMSISIVVVNSKNYTTVHMMSEDMARVKKKCKLLAGSNYLVQY